MNSRRIIILVVAVALGAFASFGIYQYTQGLKNEAYAGAELTSVWVVSEPIPKGTPAEQVINQGLIVQRDVPVDLRPTTAIVDPDAELGGLIAIAELPANHQLVVGNFVAPSVVSTGVTDRLSEKGLTALSISVDQVRGVAGLLAPGDFVNIMVQEQIAEDLAASNAGDPEDLGAAPVFDAGNDDDIVAPYIVKTRLLYQKVEILAIDNQLAPDLGEEAGADAAAINSGMLTLAVPVEATLRLASIDPGSIYLTLVPPDYEPVVTEVDYTEELLPGEDEDRLTPYPAEEDAPADAEADADDADQPAG